MSHYFIYPKKSGFEPREKANTNGIASTRRIYSSNISALVSENELDYIEAMIDRIMCDTEKYEDELESISSILEAGKKKMAMFHGFLGAYVDDDKGCLVKSEEEKIQWPDDGVAEKQKPVVKSV